MEGGSWDWELAMGSHGEGISLRMGSAMLCGWPSSCQSPSNEG